MRGSVAKLLAKLTAKTGRFDRAPSGTDALTAIDLGHALGLNRNVVEAMYIRVKWSADSATIPALVVALTSAVTRTAVRQKWRLRKTETIERLVVLALRDREVIRPRRVLSSVDSPYECGAEKCRGCRGVGRRHSRRQHKDITCERCNGTGDRHWSDAERASHCGLHPSNWPGPWETRFADVIEMLKRIEGRGMRRVRAVTAESLQEMLDILNE